MGVLLGMDMSQMPQMPGAGMPGSAPAGFPTDMPGAPPTQPAYTPKPTPPRQAAPAKAKYNSPEHEQAEEMKLQGNAHYKARRFAEAVEAYDNAYALYPQEIAYLTNKSAVLFETTAYQECIDVCN